MDISELKEWLQKNGLPQNFRELSSSEQKAQIERAYEAAREYEKQHQQDDGGNTMKRGGPTLSEQLRGHIESELAFKSRSGGTL